MTQYQTLSASFDQGVCRVRIERPEANNAINDQLVADMDAVLTLCEGVQMTPAVSILVLEGSQSVFCAGGDFDAMAAAGEVADAAPLYQLWLRMSHGPFVTMSVVRGRVNAGGVGFVAASDIVLADQSATFSLSELLFGFYPACVLPFLVRRTGSQQAHYMTLMTRAFSAQEAHAARLVDALGDDVDLLLRQHLQRLRRLGRAGILGYKAYRADTADELERLQPTAVAANRRMFSDPQVQRDIRRYVDQSKFPWES
jgi:polyketide biosynthesis enoyl-CoA hydratase PksH